MQNCPRCRSNRIHRSRTRTFLERLRRQFSTRRLFRCEACGWRGWGVETESSAEHQEQIRNDLPQPDLGELDATLEELSNRPADDGAPPNRK